MCKLEQGRLVFNYLLYSLNLYLKFKQITNAATEKHSKNQGAKELQNRPTNSTHRPPRPLLGETRPCCIWSKYHRFCLTTFPMHAFTLNVAVIAHCYDYVGAKCDEVPQTVPCECTLCLSGCCSEMNKGRMWWDRAARQQQRNRRLHLLVRHNCRTLRAPLSVIKNHQ